MSRDDVKAVFQAAQDKENKNVDATGSYVEFNAVPYDKVSYNWGYEPDSHQTEVLATVGVVRTGKDRGNFNVMSYDTGKMDFDHHRIADGKCTDLK
jgi:hypothetical protein